MCPSAARRSLVVAGVVLALGRTAPVRAQRVAWPKGQGFELVRRLLETPEEAIDLARTKLTIDQMIDPSVDTESTLSQLDAMAASLRAMLPTDAKSRLKLDALRYHLYTPSPWNGGRPFQYDLIDPYGQVIRNKLLTTYIATRKGNCVSMPLLFILLGQKLGIDVSAALAPNHVFVKYQDTDGKQYNLETTSGAGFTRDAWMRQQNPMTDESIASGLYMRPLSKKETVGVMVTTLLEHLEEAGLNEERLHLAQLTQQYSPRDVSLILHEHSAALALVRTEFNGKYARREDAPAAVRSRWEELEGRVKTAFLHAMALGWRPRDNAAETRGGGVGSIGRFDR
jgi:regulator of sirC expression with transglutaminase-like and TPR domain